MSRVILQVPMTKELREEAEAASQDYGFSSLQEIIRVLLSKLAKRELTLQIQDEEVLHLSKRAERRYRKAVEDIKAGRNVTKTANLDELFERLRA